MNNVRELIVGMLLAGVCVNGAHGAVRYVSSSSGTDTGAGTSPTAPCRSIQYAVDQAGSGDEIRIATYDVETIVFPPSVQTNSCVYTGAGTAVITLGSGKSLTLKGGYVYVRTGGQWQQGVVAPLVNGQNARRCLYAVVADGDTNHLELLDFANGVAVNGANVYADGGSLQLVGTPIHGGTATGNGGGVYMGNVDFSVSMGSYSNLSLPQMTGMLPIYSNTAARGGGLFLSGGYPIMTTVGVMGNTATGNGGGVFINGGLPSVIGGIIQGNTAGGNGGGIYLSNSVARVGGMIVNSNQACYGGAIFLDGPFAFSIETATIIANNYIQDNVAAAGKGGGIYFNAANVGMVNNVITGNRATNGAAAYLYASSPRFYQNTIADNLGSNALYVTHDNGEGRWVITPPVVNPFPPYNVLVPAGSNFIAGIAIPSWPSLTNTIISGHSTALQVNSSGNSMLENKVQLAFTLWAGNTTDIAGPGTVNHSSDLYGEPNYSSKAPAPGSMTSYHVQTNSPVIDAGVEVGLTLPGTDLLLDIDAQLRPNGKGMDIGADEVVTDPFSVWFVPSAIAQTVQPGQMVTNSHMLLNSGTQNDTYKIAASNNLWSGSVTPLNVVLNSQTYTTITVIVTVPTNAANGSTNITLVTAISQTDSNRMAVALDTTGISTNTGGASVRYVWKNSPSPAAPYASPETAGHEIQTVVAGCVSGDTVFVYPGTYDTGGAITPGYSLTNRVCITNAITLTSLAGADTTLILGAVDPVTTNGPAAVRCLYVKGNAVVSGFGLAGGHTLGTGTDWQNVAGGGACLAAGGIVSNCAVAGCSASAWGGGLYGSDTGVIRDTSIQGCSAGGNGGYGGGVYLAPSASMVNSLAIGNSAVMDGGGVYVAGGGGVYNCTIASNAAANGGGMCVNGSASLFNDIIYFNSAQSNANLSKGTASIKNSCTTPDPGGTGNVTANPLFTGGGDYHLQSNSPCIDQGTQDQAPSRDLEGNARPLDGDANGVAATDIGCYELYNAAGDSDGDGAKDGAELSADTDPLNASDYFHIVALSNAPVAKVYFTASSNRSYSLEYGTNLISNLWWVVSGQSNISGKGPLDSLTDSNAVGATRFYRLKVELP